MRSYAQALLETRAAAVNTTSDQGFSISGAPPGSVPIRQQPVHSPAVTMTGVTTGLTTLSPVHPAAVRIMSTMPVTATHSSPPPGDPLIVPP